MAVDLETEGKVTEKPEQWKYWGQKKFDPADKANTTIIIGGLTFKHERLIRGVYKSMGYNTIIIPSPTVADFQTGKEYGNYGQCNPTYFTVGHLVNFLKKLEADGIAKEDLVNNYLFLTATSPCGPCRFGMYQNEYRLALDNSGFAGFRIMTFTVTSKTDTEGETDPTLFSVDEDFTIGMVYAVMMGDLINSMAFDCRPFEVNAGESDAVVEKSLDYMEGILASLKPLSLKELSGKMDFLTDFAPKKTKRGVELIMKFSRFLYGDYMDKVLAGLGTCNCFA